MNVLNSEDEPPCSVPSIEKWANFCSCGRDATALVEFAYCKWASLFESPIGWHEQVRRQHGESRALVAASKRRRAKWSAPEPHCANLSDSVVTSDSTKEGANETSLLLLLGWPVLISATVFDHYCRPSHARLDPRLKTGQDGSGHVVPHDEVVLKAFKAIFRS